MELCNENTNRGSTQSANVIDDTQKVHGHGTTGVHDIVIIISYTARNVYERNIIF